MTESARAEVDINLRIAALRSSELGIYFKSLWRLPIARHAARRRGWGAPWVGGSGGFWPAARPGAPGSRPEGRFPPGESLQTAFSVSSASDLLLRWPVSHISL